ncbi:hypothetical protein ACTVZO_13425 [Streptomyces sp. IBSNAI002]|uniref:hypothetical protein n=1 Tax=Streptomyces sp. IBSNAI002 TaxID=3457500 RepID=UPI003FD0E1EB
MPSPPPSAPTCFDAPARLVDHARRRELKLDPTWPAARPVVAAWDRIQALPDPG